MKRSMFLAIILLLGIPQVGTAAVPPTMSYQGLVTNAAGTPLEGNLDFTFRIYSTDTGGTALWEETRSAVPVDDGVFDVVLGSVNAIDLPFDAPYWLGVTVPASSPDELAPRTPLLTSPYSFRAAKAETANVALSAGSPDTLWQTDGTNIFRPTGNVGIGTASPSAALDVAGAIRRQLTEGTILYTRTNEFGTPDGDGARMRYEESFFGPNADALLIEKTDSNQANPDGGMAFVNTGSDGLAEAALSIRGSGNVGIGTLDPGQKLDVAGTVRATGFTLPTGAAAGRVLTSDASGTGTWQPSIGGLGGGGTANYVSRFTGATTLGNSGIYETGGNIGVGTTAPSQKLDVNGNVRVADLYGGEANGVLAIVPARSQASPGAALRLYSKDAADANAVRMEITGGVATAVVEVTNSRMEVNGSITSPSQLLRVDNGGNGRAIYASTDATQNAYAALYGEANNNGGCGVYGVTSSLGVSGGSSVGVTGYGSNSGLSIGGATLGVLGRVNSSQGSGSVPVGVFGEAMHGTGISWGVAGETHSTNASAAGVKGTLLAGGAVGRAIWGEAPSLSQGWAGYFAGRVNVTGTLTKGGGSFRIDHPLDPKNKYLYHSFVESPDMMNVYNGNMTLDGDGKAWVELPAWFDALNKEFRYQLTPIGSPAPGLYVADEVAGNRFRIAGGPPNGKVSWQVTGIRKDPFAERYRIPVEEEKAGSEKGKYSHPEAYGVPVTLGEDYHPASSVEVQNGDGSD